MPPATLAFSVRMPIQIVAALFPIHLPADAPGKDAAEGPSACALATHVRVERNSGPLASAWTRPWLLKSFGN